MKLQLTMELDIIGAAQWSLSQVTEPTDAG
jgi:hypothetical protein